MMTYKCKICGGQTILDTKNGITVCEYCGTKQALPLFTEDSERLLYNSGNNYLLHSEYDKAENVFNQLLTIKPNAAELYWDLVLCKYGVTYVKDPKTGKYVPTCNRTHYTPIFADKNYRKAIELSSEEKKALFKEDAITIDNIQRGIIAVSKKEKPFDIFISYKETDANGNRTKDSVEAQKLYEKLTEAGYKVFFSRITLEDKIGTEYEPYIYAALYSSKVMLTICSSKENVEAVWVKNEWSRFLGFRQNDNEKTLLPLYFDMDKTGLPEEFALIPAYDMQTEGFEDELIRGIKKLIPLPIMKAKRRKQMRKNFCIAAACICAVAIAVTATYLKEQKNRDLYQEAQTLFNNAQYEEAAKVFDKLGDYKDSEEMLEKCAKQTDYDAAMKLYYNANYAEATWAFAALGDYEDAAEQKAKAELSWRKSLATVVADCTYYGYTGSAPTEERYYISPNGTVEKFSGLYGQAHKEIGLKEHGAVISIISAEEKLVALHQDGYVNSDWQNIVQLSTNIALRSDGKIVYNLYEDDLGNNYDWLEGLSKWENIIEFTELYVYSEAGNMYDENGMPHIYVIIGVKADGNLCAVSSMENEYWSELVSQFTNVCKLNVYEHGFNVFTEDGKFHGADDLPIVAFTKDNKIQTYSEGKLLEKSKDICQVASGRYLKPNGNIINGAEKIAVKDVVNLQSAGGCYNSMLFAIARTGEIYSCEWPTEDKDAPFKKTTNKAVVYSEWLERLD